MPPNHITNVNPTGSIASLNRGPARPSTTKYHPYSKGSAGGASTVFEGKNAQREAERHQGTTTQREQHRSGMVKNQMGLAVPRDAKDKTENDINRSAE
jgi:hypothetical protein